MAADIVDGGGASVERAARRCDASIALALIASTAHGYQEKFAKYLDGRGLLDARR